MFIVVKSGIHGLKVGPRSLASGEVETICSCREKAHHGGDQRASSEANYVTNMHAGTHRKTKDCCLDDIATLASKGTMPRHVNDDDTSIFQPNDG